MSQTAWVRIASSSIIEGRIPFIIAINVASASASDTFLATVQPSHHNVDAAVDPPPTVIGPATA